MASPLSINDGSGLVVSVEVKDGPPAFSVNGKTRKKKMVLLMTNESKRQRIYFKIKTNAFKRALSVSLNRGLIEPGQTIQAFLTVVYNSMTDYQRWKLQVQHLALEDERSADFRNIWLLRKNDVRLTYLELGPVISGNRRRLAFKEAVDYFEGDKVKKTKDVWDWEPQEAQQLNLGNAAKVPDQLHAWGDQGWNVQTGEQDEKKRDEWGQGTTASWAQDVWGRNANACDPNQDVGGQNQNGIGCDQAENGWTMKGQTVGNPSQDAWKQGQDKVQDAWGEGQNDQIQNVWSQGQDDQRQNAWNQGKDDQRQNAWNQGQDDQRQNAWNQGQDDQRQNAWNQGQDEVQNAWRQRQDDQWQNAWNQGQGALGPPPSDSDRFSLGDAGDRKHVENSFNSNLGELQRNDLLALLVTVVLVFLIGLILGKAGL